MPAADEVVLPSHRQTDRPGRTATSAPTGGARRAPGELSRGEYSLAVLLTLLPIVFRAVCAFFVVRWLHEVSALLWIPALVVLAVLVGWSLTTWRPIGSRQEAMALETAPPAAREIQTADPTTDRPSRRAFLVGAGISVVAYAVGTDAATARSWLPAVLAAVGITAVTLYNAVRRSELFFTGTFARTAEHSPGGAAELRAVVRPRLALDLIIMFVLLTLVFAGWIAAGVKLGIVHTTDPANPFRSAIGVLHWHAAAAIPLLDVPGTLHWRLSSAYDDAASGSLVLCYKALVLLPVLGGGVALLGAIWRSTLEPEHTTPSTTSASDLETDARR